MFISKFNLKNLVNRNFIDIFLCLFHKTFYNYIEFINKIKKKTFKSKLVEFKLKLVFTLRKDHSNEFQSKKKEDEKIKCKISVLTKILDCDKMCVRILILRLN